jgi:hypothetical protein
MPVALPRPLALVVAAVAALAAAGCKPGCEKLCADLDKCPGAEPSDCAKQCAGMDKLNQASGCEKQFDALEECIAKRENRCIKALCVPKQRAYDSCVLPYCNRSPPPPECR